ncbi:MAG: hypothetical protein AABW67_03135 [Nanoarchaeota archaeon]|mgnify:CR=1 FL=1
MIKKGVGSQAGIISTILLILLSIVLIGIIIGFAVPFVKEKLSAGDCLDVLGKMEIKPDYTCYSSGSSNQMYVQVHIADIRDLINGVVIELSGANSESFKIINGTNLSGVSMYSGSPNLELPNDNTERTYNITASNKPISINIYPVLKNDKICEVADTTTEIQSC